MGCQGSCVMTNGASVGCSGGSPGSCGCNTSSSNVLANNCTWVDSGGGGGGCDIATSCCYNTWAGVELICTEFNCQTNGFFACYDCCVDSGNSGGTDYAPPCDCYQVTFENECSNAASSGNCCGDCRDCEPGGTSGTAECSSDCTNWCANQGTTAGSEQTCQENNGTIRGGQVELYSTKTASSCQGGDWQDPCWESNSCSCTCGNITCDNVEYVVGPFIGCTEMDACNYDPDALCNYEPNNCDYSCYGCTDDGAVNYCPTCTIDDGSCEYHEAECIDPEAYNCDPLCEPCGAGGVYDCETTGECNYPVIGCSLPWATNYEPDATETCDGSGQHWDQCEEPYLNCCCEFEDIEEKPIGGCMDPEAANYNSEANYEDGSCIYDYEDYLCTGEFTCEALFQNTGTCPQHLGCSPAGNSIPGQYVPFALNVNWFQFENPETGYPVVGPGQFGGPTGMDMGAGGTFADPGTEALTSAWVTGGLHKQDWIFQSGHEACAFVGLECKERRWNHFFSNLGEWVHMNSGDTYSSYWTQLRSLQLYCFTNPSMFCTYCLDSDGNTTQPTYYDVCPSDPANNPMGCYICTGDYNLIQVSGGCEDGYATSECEINPGISYGSCFYSINESPPYYDGGWDMDCLNQQLEMIGPITIQNILDEQSMYDICLTPWEPSNCPHSWECQNDPNCEYLGPNPDSKAWNYDLNTLYLWYYDYQIMPYNSQWDPTNPQLPYYADKQITEGDFSFIEWDWMPYDWNFCCNQGDCRWWSYYQYADDPANADHCLDNDCDNGVPFTCEAGCHNQHRLWSQGTVGPPCDSTYGIDTDEDTQLDPGMPVPWGHWTLNPGPLAISGTPLPGGYVSYGCDFPGAAWAAGDTSYDFMEALGSAYIYCPGTVTECTGTVDCMDYLLDTGSCLTSLDYGCEAFTGEGCMDQLAYNWDELAIEDDGSCIYAPETCAFACLVWHNGTDWLCRLEGYDMPNYPWDIHLDLNMPGCLWTEEALEVGMLLYLEACNTTCEFVYDEENIWWDVLQSDSDNLCTCPDGLSAEIIEAEVISGCMNEYAYNYNSEASIDDGSCHFSLSNLGANDCIQINYDFIDNNIDPYWLQFQLPAEGIELTETNFRSNGYNLDRLTKLFGTPVRRDNMGSKMMAIEKLKKSPLGKSLNLYNKNNKASYGTTSYDNQHRHTYKDLSNNGNGWTDWAIHPTKPDIKHRHKVRNWRVDQAQSECWPNCTEGAPLHKHKLINEVRGNDSEHDYGETQHRTACNSLEFVESSIRITELHYRPNLFSHEFIEIHNTAATEVSLSGWSFDRGVKFTFPNGANIPAYGYIVIARPAVPACTVDEPWACPVVCSENPSGPNTCSYQVPGGGTHPSEGLPCTPSPSAEQGNCPTITGTAVLMPESDILINPSNYDLIRYNGTNTDVATLYEWDLTYSSGNPVYLSDSGEDVLLINGAGLPVDCVDYVGWTPSISVPMNAWPLITAGPLAKYSIEKMQSQYNEINPDMSLNWYANKMWNIPGENAGEILSHTAGGPNSYYDPINNPDEMIIDLNTAVLPHTILHDDGYFQMGFNSTSFVGTVQTDGKIRGNWSGNIPGHGIASIVGNFEVTSCEGGNLNWDPDGPEVDDCGIEWGENDCSECNVDFGYNCDNCACAGCTNPEALNYGIWTNGNCIADCVGSGVCNTLMNICGGGAPSGIECNSNSDCEWTGYHCDNNPQFGNTSCYPPQHQLGPPYADEWGECRPDAEPGSGYDCVYNTGEIPLFDDGSCSFGETSGTVEVRIVEDAFLGGDSYRWNIEMRVTDGGTFNYSGNNNYIRVGGQVGKHIQNAKNATGHKSSNKLKSPGNYAARSGGKLIQRDGRLMQVNPPTNRDNQTYRTEVHVAGIQMSLWADKCITSSAMSSFKILDNGEIVGAYGTNNDWFILSNLVNAMPGRRYMNVVAASQTLTPIIIGTDWETIAQLNWKTQPFFSLAEGANYSLVIGDVNGNMIEDHILEGSYIDNPDMCFRGNVIPPGPDYPNIPT